jgi:hypothetical protein
VRLITGLALADDGALWLGDIDGAVCRFDPTTRTCTAAFRGEAGMASAPLTSLTLDADGQVYFTTAGDGFSSYDGADWERFARPVAGIRGNAVRARHCRCGWRAVGRHRGGRAACRRPQPAARADAGQPDRPGVDSGDLCRRQRRHLDRRCGRGAVGRESVDDLHANRRSRRRRRPDACRRQSRSHLAGDRRRREHLERRILLQPDARHRLAERRHPHAAGRWRGDVDRQRGRRAVSLRAQSTRSAECR